MADTGTTVTRAALHRAVREGAARLATSALAETAAEVLVLMGGHTRLLEICAMLQRAGLPFAVVNHQITAAALQHVIDVSSFGAVFCCAAVLDNERQYILRQIPLRWTLDSAPEDFQQWDDAPRAGPIVLPDQKPSLPIPFSTGSAGLPRRLNADPACLHGPADPVLSDRVDAEPQTWLLTLPLSDTQSLLVALRALASGATLVLLPVFSAQRTLQLIPQFAVTHALFAPFMFSELLQLPERQRQVFDAGTLRQVIHTGAPCAPAIKRRMITWWGPLIREIYPGSANVEQVAISSNDWLAHVGSVGNVGSTTSPPEIRDEAGAAVPTGNLGVISWKPSRTTREVSAPDGQAGRDVGYVDEDGYLYVLDKASNAVQIDDITVYPQEAANVLAGHPAVGDVVVRLAGANADAEGPTLVATVVVNGNAGVAADAFLQIALLDFCRERLSAAKCPLHVEFCSRLPRLHGKFVQAPLNVIRSATG